ncbi:HAMP domain-containing histidine kinase [bacterium]|nr:HAMP domain-containing histidine kinase [bacterium]
MSLLKPAFITKKQIRWIVVALLVVVLIWVLVFPTKVYKTYSIVNSFIDDSHTNIVEMSIINEMQFFRLDLITAIRGLYKDVSIEIAKYNSGRYFPDQICLFMEMLSQRKELQSTFIFDKSGLIEQFSDSKLSKVELDGFIQPYVEKWKDNNLAKSTRPMFGGNSRFVTFESSPHDLGGLIVFPFNEEKATSNNDTAFGLIFDPLWFESQMPALFDSLRNNWLTFNHYARVEKQKPNQYDFGYGAVRKDDTLYWWGDRLQRKTESTYYDNVVSRYPITVAPDIDLVVVFGERQWYIDVYRSASYVKKFIRVNFIGFIAIVIVLSILINLVIKRGKRNQIALAHLAHAVKTPVARIRLDTDSLLEEMVASPDEEREIITAINRECGRMERAVQSAALSLEEGKRTLNLASGNLNKIVTDTVQAWQPQFDQVGIKFKIDSIDEALSGRFDTEMIAIMIDNLLDNALRHTMLNLEKIEQSAVVSVTLKKSDEKAVITIDDMGGGIPKAERKQIFKRFQRVRGDAASGVSGLGLGLALVKEIAEVHGGMVHVGDNDSGGARFTIELPIEVK